LLNYALTASDSLANGYISNWGNGVDPTTFDWDNEARLLIDDEAQTGNRTRFIIHRLCEFKNMSALDPGQRCSDSPVLNSGDSRGGASYPGVLPGRPPSRSSGSRPASMACETPSVTRKFWFSNGDRRPKSRETAMKIVKLYQHRGASARVAWRPCWRMTLRLDQPGRADRHRRDAARRDHGCAGQAEHHAADGCVRLDGAHAHARRGRDDDGRDKRRLQVVAVQPLYYDPNQKYPRPRRYDGSLFPLQPFNAARYAGFGDFYAVQDLRVTDLNSQFVAYDAIPTLR
jgi:hypothetical protein